MWSLFLLLDERGSWKNCIYCAGVGTLSFRGRYTTSIFSSSLHLGSVSSLSFKFEGLYSLFLLEYIWWAFVTAANFSNVLFDNNRLRLISSPITFNYVFYSPYTISILIHSAEEDIYLAYSDFNSYLANDSVCTRELNQWFSKQFEKVIIS